MTKSHLDPETYRWTLYCHNLKGYVKKRVGSRGPELMASAQPAASAAPVARQYNVKTEPKVRPLKSLHTDVNDVNISKEYGRADTVRRVTLLSSLGLSRTSSSSSGSSSLASRRESRTSSSSSGFSSSSQVRIELNSTQELWLASELQKGARLVESGERTVQTSALQHKKGGGWSV